MAERALIVGAGIAGLTVALACGGWAGSRCWSSWRPDHAARAT